MAPSDEQCINSRNPEPLSICQSTPAKKSINGSWGKMEILKNLLSLLIFATSPAVCHYLWQHRINHGIERCLMQYDTMEELDLVGLLHGLEPVTFISNMFYNDVDRVVIEISDLKYADTQHNR